MTPRKKVRRSHHPGDYHALTFSCQGRRPLLLNQPWRKALADSIDEVHTATDTALIGYVFMPEHVHLLIYPNQLEFSVGDYLAGVKVPVAQYVLECLLNETPRPSLLDELTVEERPGRRRFRFWLEGGGYDQNLFSTQAIRANLEYIHQNPVKRGLRARPTDWAWSSARHYSDDPAVRARSIGPRIQIWSEG